MPPPASIPCSIPWRSICSTLYPFSDFNQFQAPGHNMLFLKHAKHIPHQGASTGCSFCQEHLLRLPTTSPSKWGHLCPPPQPALFPSWELQLLLIIIITLYHHRWTCTLGRLWGLDMAPKVQGLETQSSVQQGFFFFFGSQELCPMNGVMKCCTVN